MSETDPRREPVKAEKEHIEENVIECPGCWDVGDRTERVGTYECTNRSCRVHSYQQGAREK